MADRERGAKIVSRWDFANRNCEEPKLRDAHGHQDVEERALDLDDARAHLVDEIQEDFVVGEIAKRGHEELGIEGNGEIAALVGNGEGLAGFPDFRSVGDDINVVFGEDEFYGIRFLAGEEGDAVDSVEETLTLERDTFLGLRRDDLTIVGIIALDEF